MAAAIVAPRYRDAALPVGPSWEEQRLLLASTESDCPADLRDRTILLTLSGTAPEAFQNRCAQGVATLLRIGGYFERESVATFVRFGNCSSTTSTGWLRWMRITGYIGENRHAVAG